MKQLLFIALILCLTSNSFSQKIHFADTSNIWEQVEPQWNDFNPAILYYHTFSFVGFTTIDTTTYNTFSFGTVREDTDLKKVYLRDISGDSDVLLIDYNLNIGDTFTTPYHKFPVVRIDSTLINSTWHKTWYFRPSLPGFYGADTITVIEGIGCIEHPTFMINDYSHCVECLEPYVFCFSNRGTTPPFTPAVKFFNNSSSCYSFLHLNADELNLTRNAILIAPNPATNELTITSTNNNNISTVAITTTVGQLVYNQKYNSDKVRVDIGELPSGLYFVRVNNAYSGKFLKR